MRRPLFWKILVGFSATIIFITQGVWLLFALRAMKSPTSSGPLGPGTLIQELARAAVQPMPPEYVILSILGGVTFSAILAWYLTYPIWRMRAGFSELAEGHFSTRLGKGLARRKDEIADLARDFDIMAERLEELVKARDRLLATVSHELRSPLARLQLAIGLARQMPDKVEGPLARIELEASRLDEMVDELLTLSRLESGISADDEYVDLAEILRVVSEDARFEASPAGVDVVFELSPHAWDWVVRGSGKLISHAFENVVRNALRFSPRDGRVEITLEDAGDFYQVQILDHGPGASGEMLKTLFQPFVHGETAEGTGFGLGLAIAQRAIIAHGGSITARNGVENGLIVCARLPHRARPFE
jgi:two-component system OmpR family sensor kinase